MGMIFVQRPSTDCSEAQGVNLKAGSAVGVVEDSPADLCSGTEDTEIE